MYVEEKHILGMVSKYGAYLIVLVGLLTFFMLINYFYIIKIIYEKIMYLLFDVNVWDTRWI